MSALFLSAATGSDAATILSTVVPLVLMIAIFYFFLIRPESKRKKELQNMLSALEVGDEVTTIGGIVGRIASIKDDEITIETGADRVRIKFTRNAIASKKKVVSD